MLSWEGPKALLQALKFTSLDSCLHEAFHYIWEECFSTFDIKFFQSVGVILSVFRPETQQFLNIEAVKPVNQNSLPNSFQIFHRDRFPLVSVESIWIPL